MRSVRDVTDAAEARAVLSSASFVTNELAIVASHRGAPGSLMMMESSRQRASHEMLRRGCRTYASTHADNIAVLAEQWCRHRLSERACIIDGLGLEFAAWMLAGSLGLGPSAVESILQWARLSDGHEVTAQEIGLAGRALRHMVLEAGRSGNVQYPNLYSCMGVDLSDWRAMLWVTRSCASGGVHTVAITAERLLNLWRKGHIERLRAAGCVTETLWAEAPVAATWRTANADVIVGSQLVRKGQRVRVSFDRMHERTLPKRDGDVGLLFGHGAHACPGRDLAMVTLEALAVSVAEITPV
jgi:hypothetical protein